MAEEQMQATFVQRGKRASELPRLAADELEASQLASLLTPSLFGDSACIVDFADAKPDKEFLKILVSAAPDPQVTVAILDPKPLVARQKIYQQAQQSQQAQIITSSTPRKTADVSAWVQARAKQKGLALEREAAQYLAEAFGSDLASIASELLKLELVEGRLSRALVSQVVGREVAGDSFVMLAAATTSRTQQALEQLRRLLLSGEDPFKLLGVVVWQYGLVARCVALLQLGKINEYEAAEKLDSKPYPTKKALEIARQLDEAQILQHLQAILAADLAMKSGQDADKVLERLLIQLSLKA